MQRSFRSRSAAAVLGVLGLVAGCRPSGQRALEEGDRLLRAGDLSAAVPLLERAVETLPGDARALNHLALAYQSAGRADEARRAYLRALEYDRNLPEAHHNLALLHLDAGELLDAERSLRAYLAARPVDGRSWARLGDIQFRAGRIDEAERSFSAAQKADANDAASWNTLGLISVQKRRFREARDRFTWALRLDANHAPAHLNLAVLHQQHLADRRAALAHYRDWLALSPGHPHAPQVADIVRQLETQLGLVVPLRPEFTNAVPRVAQPPTNPPSFAVRTNVPPPPSVPALRTNPPFAAPPRPAPTIPPPQPTTVPPAVAVARPAAGPTNPPPFRPAPREVVRVEDDAPLRPARDVDPVPAVPVVRPPAVIPGTSAPPSAPSPAVAAPIAIPNPSPVAAEETEVPRRSLLRRINPVNWGNPVKWFQRDGKTNATPSPPAVTPLNPAPSIARDAAPTRPAAVATRPELPLRRIEPPAAPTPRPAPPRYIRRAAVLLQPGDRAAAQPEFTAAAEAHRRRDLAAAVAGYRRATAADPAFFEAHHNLALVALDQGDLPLALLSGENALQLRPADLDTRRDFARALQAAGHAADAAEQLELVLSSRPADTALHLAVAGIYAADLGDTTRARAHYERVLALEPAHPQAGTIRSWLAANPR